MKAPIKENHYPGTLNFGDAFPVTVEAICFLEFVEIDGLTLFLMVVAEAAGVWIGVGIVSKLNIQKIRIAMAVCLIATAVVLFCKVSEIGPFEEKKSDLAVEDVENELELVAESVENEPDYAAKDVGNERRDCISYYDGFMLSSDECICTQVVSDWGVQYQCDSPQRCVWVFGSWRGLSAYKVYV